MERNINVWLPLACPPLGTCPVTQACALDRESNQVLFGLQASTQSTESQQPGLKQYIKKKKKKKKTKETMGFGSATN